MPPTTDIDLPELDASYAVDPDTVAEFQRDGHTVVRGLCTPEEIAVYGRVIEGAALRHNTQTAPLEERDTYGKAFLQIENLWQVDDGVKRFSLAPRFARVAADLLGVEGVRIYHDQALFKEPHGGHTPWHQDQNYWPLDCPTVTMWMPLVDVPAEIGSMTFVDGSHERPDLGSLVISDESHDHYERMVTAQGLSSRTHGAMRAGDATFHAGWTAHRAPANPTDRMRSVMTVIYHPDGVQIVEPRNSYQEADLRHWFPGCEPGQPAASQINPLLWSRTP